MRYLKKFNEERYLRIFEYFNDIENIDYICEKYDIIDYTINSDRSIDVDNIINLFNRNLRKLPLKFNKVNGDFSCHWNMLITLEGSPIEIIMDRLNDFLLTIGKDPVKKVNGYKNI